MVLLTPEIVEIPKASVPGLLVNAATGKFDNVLDGDRAAQLLQLIDTLTGHRTWATITRDGQTVDSLWLFAGQQLVLGLRREKLRS